MCLMTFNIRCFVLLHKNTLRTHSSLSLSPFLLRECVCSTCSNAVRSNPNTALQNRGTEKKDLPPVPSAFGKCAFLCVAKNSIGFSPKPEKTESRQISWFQLLVFITGVLILTAVCFFFSHWRTIPGMFQSKKQHYTA